MSILILALRLLAGVAALMALVLVLVHSWSGVAHGLVVALLCWASAARLASLQRSRPRRSVKSPPS